MEKIKNILYFAVIPLFAGGAVFWWRGGMVGYTPLIVLTATFLAAPAIVLAIISHLLRNKKLIFLKIRTFCFFLILIVFAQILFVPIHFYVAADKVARAKSGCEEMHNRVKNFMSQNNRSSITEEELTMLVTDIYPTIAIDVLPLMKNGQFSCRFIGPGTLYPVVWFYNSRTGSWQVG